MRLFKLQSSCDAGLLPFVNLSLSLSIEDSNWNALPDLEGLCTTALEETCRLVGFKPQTAAEISILLTSDLEIRQLNKQWRGMDKPTNVLSFPAVLPDKIAKSPVLGDLALAYETIAAEAAQDEKTLADHLTHLVIHGFLHILGYDHETLAEADQMEKFEISILEKLGIANPYTDYDPLFI